MGSQPLIGQVDPGGGQRAHWVSASTIVWPGLTEQVGSTVSLSFRLYHRADGGLNLAEANPDTDEFVLLTLGPPYPAGVEGRFQLGGQPTLEVPDADPALVGSWLTGQVLVAAVDSSGQVVDSTGLQIAGVLDDLFATSAPLGVVWDDAVPTLRVWAPTARSVALVLFDGPVGGQQTLVPMSRRGGLWSATGEPSWNEKYYQYRVEVYVPSTGRVETNLVTDPWSVALARNSTRSQIVDLAAESTAPPGWNELVKPPLEAIVDKAIYELHIRDFSIDDESVPRAERGTYAAFTHHQSVGMTHLTALARAGVGCIHLLPCFDFATVDEDRSGRREPDRRVLASLPPDSDGQQALVAATADLDGFNWGYDPFHYTVPEGSYATDGSVDGVARSVEFRRMVQALNQVGLRVVMDVVYNHTHRSGQDPGSVLDRIVPGYYHRLEDDGTVADSTCCANTAPETAMMARLVVDSIVTWATAYKIDGFRFDLMGHHPRANILAVRAALDGLTVENDGVDGARIILYGEGWNFGEVANNARFVQATQLNMAGTGVATFSDRLRDALRGGGPFDGGEALVANQGYLNGLYHAPNPSGPTGDEARHRLLLAADQIRVGLAGNLARYRFIDRTGTLVSGAQVDYNGGPCGYTASPSENLVYIEAHDNQTLFDICQYRHRLDTPMADRVRSHNLGNAIVALAQGVPFYHAGQDLLRSKSMDRDSYNSGDWFNRLDLGCRSNNWAVGLPPAEANAANWYLMAPRLADPALKPSPEQISFAGAVAREWLAVRGSSPLFRLRTAEQVQDRVRFENTGPDQIPGLIVMTLMDRGYEVDLDPDVAAIVVLFNPTTEPVTYRDRSLTGASVRLHPILARSVDPVVRTASFVSADAAFNVPSRSAAVFTVH